METDSQFNVVVKIDGPGEESKSRFRWNFFEFSNVGELRKKLSDICSRSLDSLHLLYAGKLLKKDEETLNDAGLKANSTLYVLPNHKPEVARQAAALGSMTERREMTDDEMSQFLLAFGLACRNPTLNVVMKRLTERENLESMAAACPGLLEDKVALALLAKPEMLIMMLAKLDSLKKVSREHPALIEAMTYLASAVHNDKPTDNPNPSGSGANQQGSSGQQVLNPFSYNLDDLSDVDEEDEYEEMETQNQGAAGGASGIVRDRSFSAITPDQLAAAIAAAQQSSTGGNASRSGASGGGAAAPSQSSGGMTGWTAGPSHGSSLFPPSGGASASSSAPASASATGITTEMFRNALQQAMAASLGGVGGGVASTAGASGSNPAPMDTSQPAAAAAPDNMQASVDRMKEMGIVDEGLARKALQVMGGDLQAAIDLIFSGWVGEDDSAA